MPTSADRDTWTSLRARARRHHGLFTRDDARLCGISESGLRRLRKQGLVQAVAREVFLAGSAPVDRALRERAVLLSLGPTAALAEESAAAFWNLCPAPRTVTIEVPLGPVPEPQPDVVVRRTRHPRRIETHDGRGITTPARTLVALGRIWNEERLRLAMLDAVQRELCTVEAIAADVATVRGRPGTGLVRAVLREFEPAFESVLGEEGVLMLRAAGLGPALDERLEDAHGRTRHPDALMVGSDGRALLDVEFDGWAFHGRRQQQQADKARDRDLLAVGVATVRFTTDDVRQRPEACVATVLAVIRSLERRRAG